MKTTEPRIDPLLLTADGAMAELGISRKSLYIFMRDRQLPHIRIGRLLRFKRESLASWAESQAVILPAPATTEKGAA